MVEKIYEDIKRIIFARKIGECRTREEWRKLYDEGARDLPIDHLSSCPNCLDIANELLGLPALSERNPFDNLSRDSGNDGPFNSSDASGGSSSKKRETTGADSSSLFARLEEARRERYSSAPEEMTLAVNGWPIASRRVQPGVNSLTARPRMEEPIESLELLDDKGRLLFHLPVSEACAGGADGHWPAISLGADGLIDLAVTWIDENPEIHLEYRDKRLQTAESQVKKPIKDGFVERLLKKFSMGWRAFSFGELALAASALLIALLIPVALIVVEASRMERMAALENEIENSKLEREKIERRLLEEQSLRKTAEIERDRLRQSPSDAPGKENPENEPQLTASLGMRMQLGEDGPEAINFEVARGSLPKNIAQIMLSREKGARFTVKAPIYDDENRPYNGYLIRLSIPNRPPTVAQFKAVVPQSEAHSVTLNVEIYNAGDLPTGAKAEAMLYGLVKGKEILIGTIPFRIE